MDNSGNLFSSTLYDLYGGVRYQNASLPTDRGYTGQREEAGIGLLDYHARFYDQDR